MEQLDVSSLTGSGNLLPQQGESEEKLRQVRFGMAQLWNYHNDFLKGQQSHWNESKILTLSNKLRLYHCVFLEKTNVK